MQKTLFASMALGMALCATTATAQEAQSQTVRLQDQLVTPAQLKADAVAMKVKGVPSDNYQAPAVLVGGNSGERVYLGTFKPQRAARRGAPSLPTDFLLYGTVMSSQDWPIREETNPETGEKYQYQEAIYDIYTYDGNTLEAFGTDPDEIATNYIIANGGGTIVGDEYLFNHNQMMWGSYSANLYLAYNLVSGTLEGFDHDQDATVIANQVAYDATTGLVYGQFYNSRKSGYVWGTRDTYTGLTSPIANMSSAALRALAFDHVGRCWAIDTNNDLLQIDKATGLTTVVGPTGLTLSGNIMSGAINPTDDVFYFVGQLTDNTTHLYAIDYATGQATLVNDMPGNAMIAGAAFENVVYADAAPDAAVNLALQFDKDSYSGTCTFIAPSTTVHGDALTAATTVVVTLDGAEVKTLSATAGESVTVDLAVEAAGLHVVQVTASNEAGDGVPATMQKWIGLDYPAVVNELSVVNTDYNNAIVSWQAPTIGIHGGYVDPAKLSYKVTTNTGEVEATDLKVTELAVSKSGSALSRRGYIVTAYCDGLQGPSLKTSRIYYGNPKKAPCSFEFESINEFDLWQALDANNDYYTWTFNSSNMFAEYKYNRSSAADDYLFSPPIHLQAGQYYNLKSLLASEMGHYRERFSIHLAKAQTVKGVFKTIHGEVETEFTGEDPAIYYNLFDPFKVDEEGDYYLAYHCSSLANKLGLQLHSVQIEKGATAGAPAAADKVSIAAGEKGGLSATVTFTAPTKATDGSGVGELIKAELYREDKLAATLRDIEPGKQYDITDSKLAVQGVNKYRLFIYNDEGKGLPSELSVYVGQDIPGYCDESDVNLVDGNVQITWSAPSEGKNGGYVNPTGITYSVVRQTEDYPETYKGTATECYDNDFPFYGEQLQVYYGIFPTNKIGDGPGTGTPTIIGGEAYTMPFEETFGKNTASSLWVVGYEPAPTATFDVPESPSYDSDGYSLACNSNSFTGGQRSVTSGKISVTGENPALVFALRGTSANNRIELYVSTDGVIQHVTKVGESRTSKDTWKLVGLDLTPYVGKEIVFAFNCTLSGRNSLYIDDFKVVDGGIGDAEDVTVGIGSVIADRFNSASYDLSGRRANSGSSIVITDGKKVVK